MKHRWTATILIAMTLVLGGCAPDDAGAPAEGNGTHPTEAPAQNDFGY